MFVNNCAGRIFDHVKVAQLETKWQQDSKAQESGLSAFLKQKDEETKANMLKLITDKMTFGKRLTRDEMDFLRKHSPEMYSRAVRAENEREEYRQALRNCKTKEQALHLHIVTVMQPDKDNKLALFDEFFEFANSKEFGDLPNEKDLDEEEQNEENQNKHISKKRKPFQESEIKIKSPDAGHYSTYNKDRILVASPSKYPPFSPPSGPSLIS
jgi:hypothetical protein